MQGCRPLCILRTLARSKNFYWRSKDKDVKSYVKGCLTCQQKKDSREKKLGDATSLEIPDRRWGSIATDFIVPYQRQRLVLTVSLLGLIDCLEGYILFLQRKKIQLLISQTPSLQLSLSCMEYRTALYLTEIPSLRRSSGQDLWSYVVLS